MLFGFWDYWLICIVIVIRIFVCLCWMEKGVGVYWLLCWGWGLLLFGVVLVGEVLIWSVVNC